MKFAKQMFDLYQKIISPVRFSYLKKVRKDLKRDLPISILASNCIAGEIYNNLNERFLSPTINLYIDEKYFIKVAKNPKHYLSGDNLIFIKNPLDYEACPVAMVDDVEIHFLHYSSEEEAAKKWKERCNRINWDNLYIIMTDLDLPKEDFLEFQKIENCKRKIMFTTNDAHSQYKDVEKIHMYSENSYVRRFGVKKMNGFRDFEKFFDYVAWLNGNENYII